MTLFICSKNKAQGCYIEDVCEVIPVWVVEDVRKGWPILIGCHTVVIVSQGTIADTGILIALITSMLLW